MTSVSPRYRPNISAVKERAMKALGSNRFFKAEIGKNYIRILPGWDPEDPDGMFFADQVLHYGFELDGRNTTIPCSAAMVGEACPVCELMAWLEIQPGMDELAKKFKPRMKVLYNVVDRKDGLVKIWATGPEKRETILSVMEEEDYRDILDPEQGRDWVLERTGEGLATRYPSLQPRGNASPIGVPWEDKLTNLKKEFVEDIMPTRAEIIKIISDCYGGKFPISEIF
mgnify:CR=1 FL=1